MAAAILYLIFNVAEAVVPVTVFYTLIDPFVSQWSGSYNSVYKAAWYLLWIGNMVIYGIPAVVGGFTWMWNVYIVGGYIAWNQYMVVWGGTILQFIDMIMFIVAAAIYQTSSPASSIDTSYTAWMTLVAWAVPTICIYVGYWLLNDNFLTYYVISEIINKLGPIGNVETSQLGATFTVVS